MNQYIMAWHAIEILFIVILFMSQYNHAVTSLYRWKRSGHLRCRCPDTGKRHPSKSHHIPHFIRNISHMYRISSVS